MLSWSLGRSLLLLCWYKKDLDMDLALLLGNTSPRQFFSHASSRKCWESIAWWQWQGWRGKEEVPLPSKRKGTALPGRGTISVPQLSGTVEHLPSCHVTKWGIFITQPYSTNSTSPKGILSVIHMYCFLLQDKATAVTIKHDLENLCL